MCNKKGKEKRRQMSLEKCPFLILFIDSPAADKLTDRVGQSGMDPV